MNRSQQQIIGLITVFAAVAAHAQMSALPPTPTGTTRRLAPPPVLQDAPRGLPPIKTLQPLESEVFPYNDRPLRDPFWKVGYFPPEWGVKEKPHDQMISASEWQAPLSQIEISGVSRMGDRVVALINGELKTVGDIVEVSYLGKIFQWKIGEIKPDGNVRFDRHQIVNDTPVNRSTP